MKITNVHFVPGFAAFYFDDQTAIKAGARQDGFIYVGPAQTNGFETIRQSGECVSIILELENGQRAEGDCVAVQYSGTAGRDPLFTAARFIPFLQDNLTQHLMGLDVSRFIDNARFFDELQLEGQRLHTAIRYGLSQSLLDATAKASGRMRTEVICDEFGLPMVVEPLSLFGQSGDDRYGAVDKMILKRVDALPHGLINNVPQKLGENGGKLAEYVAWLAQRIQRLRHDKSYHPQLHIDVYGTIGLIFDNDAARIADYLKVLEERAYPFELYIEGPADAGSKSGQIKLLSAIKSALAARDCSVRIVADEWCNTYQDVVDFVDSECCHMVQIKTPDLGSIHNSVEAVLYSKKNGVEAYQGGTCNETDISARCCLSIALATRPQRLLVKPGMGFDEGMTVVANEMKRNLAILSAKTNEVGRASSPAPRLT
ncbi:methylaspartate ammonia-lyase [Pelagibius sp. Alg239-R121]|uniref:methylaspartate ammonia-lyase n=1 Tax=Pelagibius sp. Alg239-R121 TaxID=2993448 RepID=UPI0024A65E30|nr:methylaspartate ammonia-lyase [Pelagibius sp. Alg239-R121]